MSRKPLSFRDIPVGLTGFEPATPWSLPRPLGVVSGRLETDPNSLVYQGFEADASCSILSAHPGSAPARSANKWRVCGELLKSAAGARRSVPRGPDGPSAVNPGCPKDADSGCTQSREVRKPRWRGTLNTTESSRAPRTSASSPRDLCPASLRRSGWTVETGSGFGRSRPRSSEAGSLRCLRRLWGSCRRRRLPQGQHQSVRPVEERGAVDGVGDGEVVQACVAELLHVLRSEGCWSGRERD